MTETRMGVSPPKDSFYNKPLFQLISSKFPEFRSPQGVFQVHKFGEAIEMSHEGVYKWFRGNCITAAGVRKVIALGEGRISKEDLIDFVLA